MSLSKSPKNLNLIVVFVKFNMSSDKISEIHKVVIEYYFAHSHIVRELYQQKIEINRAVCNKINTADERHQGHRIDDGDLGSGCRSYKF